MANTYTPNIGLVNPNVSDYNWQDEWYRNNDISDVLVSSLLGQNRLIEGGKVTTSDFLNIAYDAGSAWINGAVVSWVGGGMIPSFGPSGLDFYLNWIYVDSFGVVGVSATKPFGDFILLSVLDVDSSHILRIFDIRNFKSSVPLDITERGNRNYLDNVGPDIWFIGTSQTTAGFLSDNRWNNHHNGVTKNHLRVAFTPGQTEVPGNPKYFSRTIVTNAVGSTNYALKQQGIEGVHSLSGKTVTLSFWAKADAPKNIAIEFQQIFGSGGSATINGSNGCPSALIYLSTVWQKYSLTVDIPSISGKIVGSTGDDTLVVVFWFNAGATYSTRAANLGQQSGTFDLCKFCLEEGAKVTEEISRTLHEEILRVERTWQEVIMNFMGDVTSGYSYPASMMYSSRMKKDPIVHTGMNLATNAFPYVIGALSINTMYITETRTANVTSVGLFRSHLKLDAE